MEQTRSHIRKFVVNCLLDNPDSVDNLAIFQDVLKQIANYIIQKYGNDDLLSLINHLIRDGQKDPKIRYKLRELTSTPKV